MKTNIYKALLWLKLQLKAISFDTWTRDKTQVVRHYKFRAVPTSLACTEYNVKIVRSKIGGSSQVIRDRWTREHLESCQTACC